MNLIEAVKSGKRFRRNGWEAWHLDGNVYYSTVHGLFGGTKAFTDGKWFSLMKADILADDWEIEEKRVEVTRSQVIEVLRSVFDDSAQGVREEVLIDMVCIRLGLRD